MAQEFNTRTEGFDDLRRTFSGAQTTIRLARRQMLQSMGRVIQPVLVSETPKRTGRLRQSTGIRITGEQTGMALLIRQSARSANGSFYGRFVRQGTRPHEIRPVKAKALRFVASDGSTVFARRVQHPGTRANRYHERAFQQVRPRLNQLADEAGEQITQRLAD